jgi:WD40 repeat protein
MPEALRKRLRLTAEDVLPPAELELQSATDAMSAFEHICLAIPASGALIAVRDAAGLHSVGSLGDAPEVGSRLPSDFGMALECLQTGAVVSADFADDAQRVLRVGMTMEGVSQIRSAVALPMRTGGVIVGVIAVFSMRESAIQSHDIKALARIADFWGPMMADEWFPDGIPSAIAANAPATAETLVANSLATEFPLIDELPTLAPPAPVTLSSQPEPVSEHIQHEHELLSPAEFGTIAATSTRVDSPVFLAPAEPIPPEAFHPGEPHRLTWLILLAVFLVVLLPFWCLKSRSIHNATTGKISVSAPSAKPSLSPYTDASSAIASPGLPDALPTSAKKQNTVTTSDIAQPPISKSSPPDDDIPKPLPDLNTPPPAKAAQAAAAPKPSLPALLSRILKSPNTSSAKSESESYSTSPTAPDIAAVPQPSPSSDTAPNESPNSAAPSAEPASAPEPEPAQPINPAGGLQPPGFALAQTLKAHSGWVSSLAFSPTGMLASASWDRTVKFWNITTGREVRAVNEKLKQVQAIAFTRDGKLLAAEDTSYTVAIFDAATGARLRELPTDKSVPSVGISWVYSIAFSPDGRWLASAVDDKTVRIWDVATGAKIRDLSGPRRPVIYTAFSPNGELVATGNDEKSIQIWNVASGAPTSTLAGHKKVINAVAFSPDGKLLASASGDKTIRLWHTATGKHIRTLSGHQAAVSSISFSADGRWLASGSWDKTVRIWNVANGKEVQTLRPDARAIYSVTFDPRGRWLAAGSEDGGVEIWQWNRAASSTNPAPANP